MISVAVLLRDIQGCEPECHACAAELRHCNAFVTLLTSVVKTLPPALCHGSPGPNPQLWTTNSPSPLCLSIHKTQKMIHNKPNHSRRAMLSAAAKSTELTEYMQKRGFRFSSLRRPLPVAHAGLGGARARAHCQYNLDNLPTALSATGPRTPIIISTISVPVNLNEYECASPRALILYCKGWAPLRDDLKWVVAFSTLR